MDEDCLLPMANFAVLSGCGDCAAVAEKRWEMRTEVDTLQRRGPWDSHCHYWPFFRGAGTAIVVVVDAVADDDAAEE